jgi:Domain of unknown function (DUF4157)
MLATVDEADHEEVAVEFERSRNAPAREVTAPEAFHDRRPPLENLASSVGNRGFGQLVARMSDGEGILAGGLVHPDVQAAIAAAKGGGERLDRRLSESLSAGFGAPVDQVRVHTGEGADALARAVSARAFTVGQDIFFANNEYRPGTRDGNELIKHEVAHTQQQLDAPQTGPLTVSMPGDAMEREAEAVARELPA